jgi:hypothetical protein
VCAPRTCKVNKLEKPRLKMKVEKGRAPYMWVVKATGHAVPNVQISENMIW